jgi:hypothetical protein
MYRTLRLSGNMKSILVLFGSAFFLYKNVENLILARLGNDFFTERIFTLSTGSTALRYTETSVLLSARRIGILPLNRHDDL